MAELPIEYWAKMPDRLVDDGLAAEVTRTELLVILAMIRFKRQGGWPGVDEVARCYRMGDTRHLKRAISSLAKRGWLETDAEGGGSGRLAVRRLCLPGTVADSATPTVADSATPTVANSATPTVANSATPTVANSATPTVADSATKARAYIELKESKKSKKKEKIQRVLFEEDDGALEGMTIPTAEIYQAYPRHENRQEAIKSIVAALHQLKAKRHDLPDASVWLLAQVKLWAEVRRLQIASGNSDRSFTALPSTWFNKKRYENDLQQMLEDEKADARPRGNHGQRNEGHRPGRREGDYDSPGEIPIIQRRAGGTGGRAASAG
jgi:hypothetical protein